MLNHTTSFIKRDPWNENKVKVGDYISVEQPDHNKNTFNPHPKYFIVGYIIYQLKGDKARKRLARCCFNMIGVNVNTYAHIQKISKNGWKG